MVEFSKTPIDKAQLVKLAYPGSCITRTYLAVFMIDHDIVRFDIPVHNAFAVTEVQCLDTISISYGTPNLVKRTFNSSKI